MQWFSIMLQILNLSMASEKNSIPPSSLQKFLPPLSLQKILRPPNFCLLPPPRFPACGVHNECTPVLISRVLSFAKFRDLRKIAKFYTREIFNTRHMHIQKKTKFSIFLLVILKLKYLS